MLFLMKIVECKSNQILVCFSTNVYIYTMYNTIPLYIFHIWWILQFYRIAVLHTELSSMFVGIFFVDLVKLSVLGRCKFVDNDPCEKICHRPYILDAYLNSVERVHIHPRIMVSNKHWWSHPDCRLYRVTSDNSNCT